MRFLVAFGVSEKSVFTRLFYVFATDMLANFQGPALPKIQSKCTPRRIGFISPYFRYTLQKTILNRFLRAYPV